MVPLLVTMLGVVTVAGTASAAATTAAGTPVWQTTWTSPTDLAVGYTYNSTTRDIATVAAAGDALTFTFSNLWSSTPTTFAAVTVGVQQSGANVVAGTLRAVTFDHGSRSITIGPHARVTSDAVVMRVHAGETLAVSVAVTGYAEVSVHYCCNGRIDSYATANSVGDVTANPQSTAFDPGLTSPYMRWLSAIAVHDSPAQGTIVALGDSITDGFGYLNQGYSWVNALQSRLDQLPADQRMSVVNEGIAGNTLTVFPPRASFAALSGGLPGVTRLSRDALSLPGVKDVIVFLGTNDIWFGAGGETGHPIPPYGTAGAIEAGLRQVIAATHAHGIKIFAVTLLPRSSSTAADHDLPEYWSPAEQATLSAVNAWILSPNAGFDGVLNLAAVMGNVYDGACQPWVPFAPYFNPDHLHPDVAGQTVMANAIATTQFQLPEAPLLPAPLAVTPTPGCPAAHLAASILAASAAPPPTTTTSVAPTTTVTTVAPPAPVRPSHRLTLYLIGAAVVLVLLAWNERRRRVRRRELRRRAMRAALPPRPPFPPGRPTPPRHPPRHPPR